ncbi:hypothetical protein QQS21_012305 [Conoideocrella luteorostrata]|uniref:NB-ARC domain-containing protein n=1 Tax=Conoideocrella luteorostrata TaxID=1105319 RepID=A0AAJ0CE59_9HYPO|nr:hypothetical protein QQS21_012305 [Conoideocrella luteorostrata]
MSEPTHEQREVSHSHFRDSNSIIQGNIQGNVYYNTPHPPARAEPVRVIPYPRNEDLVHRGDLIKRIDELLPPTLGSHCAALWGLGGSGKTQIALDYVYRRWDLDDECNIFWVHADSEATFLADYKTIGKNLRVGEQHDGPDLLDVVCSAIQARSKWVMILDNADDLGLFGVGRRVNGEGTNESLYKYVPHASQGTVLWTTRDAHIAGTLVGARRGVEVRSMAMNEATTLLARTRDELPTVEEALGELGVDALVQELQCLPLAISQAGAYMRRMSMTADQYLGLLRQGTTRWEVLKVSDTDRHRRLEVSNSVLETWRISTEQIRVESEMSYRILHVLAYVDNQDIPYEMLAEAAYGYDEHSEDDECSTRQVSELEVLEAVARLREFSFLSLRQTDDGDRTYEMHKLVQEAVRYGLRMSSLAEMTSSKASEVDNGPKRSEAYYCSRALQVVDDLFPSSEPTSWAQCEQYMMHAVKVGKWAEVSGAKIVTATLLQRVSYFLYERGRWREKKPVDSRAWGLTKEVLGEKHPNTINSMASLAVTYHQQGQYNKAETLVNKVLALRREVLGERHPDTISSMAYLASTYYAQGRYDEDREISVKVLELRQEVLGKKHPNTISSMADLAATYSRQGQYYKAETLVDEALALRREVLGERHPDTINSMANLAVRYIEQGRYNEAETLVDKTLALQREVLGERHLNAINSMASLAATYHQQGQYNKAETLKDKALALRKEVLGERYLDTISSMAYLASTYHQQGQYNKAETLKDEALALRREVLGERHPDTINSMASLASTYHQQGQYNKAETLKDEALALRREVLGERHPDTINSMAELASTYYAQGRYAEGEEILVKVLELRREVLGERHPDTINSMVYLASMYHAQGRSDEALQLHQTALELRQHALGGNHPDTVQSMAYLASTQGSLQQLLSLVEPAQSLSVEQDRELEVEEEEEEEEEGKPRYQSSWDIWW